MPPEPQTGQSLCPQCLGLIPAWREQDGPEVYQVKECPEHGSFRTLIWRGPPDFSGWQRPKIPAQLSYHARPVERGCPFDCGLCPEHRQRTCTAILEVTQACDLGCPVCYADSRPKGGPAQGGDPSQDEVAAWYQEVLRAAGGCTVQLSGGEPTLRDDLPELVALGRAMGVAFIQVNTNGLRLGRDPGYAAALAQSGLSSIFLQFDGVDDAVHRRLRGRPLLDAKLAAIRACGDNGIGVVLVPTMAAGVNLDQAGPILALAQELSPTVRAVHFQPVSRFGRFPRDMAQDDRLTLPELMQAIDQQTGGRFPAASFRPPGCENALCSFQGNFLLHDDGRVQPLSQGHNPTCCPAPEPAEQGALRAIARVERQWAAPPTTASPSPADQAGAGCACGSHGGPRPIALDEFISLARRRTLSVSAMAFQDVWNLDLERARDCCIHVMAPDRRLVPFCLYNLTSAGGERLYRP